MRLLLWLLCAAAAIVSVAPSEENSVSRPKRASSEKKVVCYYTNWSVYRPGTAKFSPQNINPYLCTHLIYAFGGLSKENALKPFDKYQDIEQGGYAKFNGLKTYNKNLKTMLAIGGWNEGSARFSPLVADAERRRELVKNTVKFLRQNHFDGLDLDWEYPSFRDGGKPRDRDNYATLVQEFREEFERESEKTGRPRLLLTMAVPAGIEYIDKGYDVPKLNKYLDWLNILSYDYHSAFEPAINHHSPLFSLEEDDEYNFDAQLNIDHTVQHYIKLGAERSKLVLGIPTYGRSYTLFNPDATEIGAPADGPGEQGDATREKGYLAYYEICERVKSGGWTVKNPNPEAMGPYAYKNNQWVGYDDEDIVRAKAKYVNDNDLGGIMFWSIDNDDFRGKCHGKPYPLIEAAKEALLATSNELIPTRSRSESSRSSSKKQEETSSKPKTRKTRLRTKSTTTTESSRAKDSGRTSTTPQPPTTPDPGSDFVCKDEGFFPHPRDCKKYFWCLDSGPSNLGIVAHQFTCPSGLVFNKISDSCDYARNVICKTKSEATTTTTTTTSTSTTTARTTTIRNRLVITATPPRTTTTTTTEPPEEEEEEEEEDEEDPGTIKELINLIKKLGGVEQLEKQLNLQNSDGKEKIKPSLYSRVLQGRRANRYRGINLEQEQVEEQQSTPKYVSVFRNRPIGPQGPSTEETSTSTRGADKPRYVTIQRNRPTKKPVPVEEDSEEEEVEEETEKPKQKAETPRPFRRRPSSDTTTEKEYVVLKRSRPPKEEEISTPRYKNIVRTRSTTEAPAEEEEEEEEEDEEEEGKEEDEETPSEAEEEEVVEEEEKEEVEPGQKLKKYSSIIRNNKKKVSNEEESKVSGPQGSQYVSGAPSSTTDSAFEERNNVNNVNTVTRPRYVEIRRTTPTLPESSSSDVNIVNNLSENDRVNKDIQTETNEVSHSETEEEENPVKGFQRRITTELVRKPTKPSIRFSTLERTTPISVESTKKDEFPSFIGRFRTQITTESTSAPETKPFIRYRTINRANADKPVITNENEQEQFPRRDRFRSSTVTSTSSTTERNVNGEQKRFQFAPRSKPTILQPKPLESTTESFKITVPDLVDPSLTENILGLSNSPIPSVTLEPATATAPSIVDSTILDTTENDITLTTFNEKFSPSSKQYVVPTTSTETTIVTSITESSFTERKRISVPKKDRFKSDTSVRFTSPIVTVFETEETTKPLFRQSSFKGRTKSTTPVTEATTEGRRRRYKFKTTTTTSTEAPAPEKKYVPKKIRTFKKIISTEKPESVSSTTEETRFQPRNKLRQAESNPNNSLFSRFKTGRRKNILFKKEEPEEDDDDLVVEQSATFFGDDIENNERYILGGGLKQKSEKEYLNADIYLKTVPTVEEEERLSNKAAEELTNSLELTKVAATPGYTNNKTIVTDTNLPIRNRFVTVNPNLRNLRTRTRQPVEAKTEQTEVTRTSSQTEKVVTRNSLYTPNRNVGLRTLRTRNQLNNNQEKNNDFLTQSVDTKEPVNYNVLNSNPSVSNFKQEKDRASDSDENVSDKTAEKIGAERGFGTKQPNRFNFNTPSPNLTNVKSFRAGGSQQEREFSTEPTVGNFDEERKFGEPAKNNLFSSRTRNPNFRFNTNRIVSGDENVSYKTTEENTSEKRFETREPNAVSQRTKYLRSRNQQRNEASSSADDLNSPEKTNSGESLQNNEGFKVRKFRNRTEQTSKTTEATVSSTLGNIRQERNFRNLRTQTSERLNEQTTENPASLSSSSGTRGTRRPTTLYSSSQPRFRASTRVRPEDSNTSGATITSTFETASTKEPIVNNFVITRFEENLLRYQAEQEILQNKSETSSDFTAGTPLPSTFGTRIANEIGSTVSLPEVTTTETPTTFGAKITNTISSSTRTSSSSSFGSSSSLGSIANTAVDSAFSSSITSSVGSTVGPSFSSSVRTSAGSTTGTVGRSSLDNTIRTGTTRSTFSVNTTPSSGRTLRTRVRFNNAQESTRSGAIEGVNENPTVASVVQSNSSPSNFRSFKTRTRQNFTAVAPDSKLVAEEPQEPVINNIIPPNTSQSNFRVLRTRTRVKVNSTEPLDQTAGRSSLEETTVNGNNKFPKDRRRVLVRARPVQPTLDTKEREDNEIESPEEPTLTNSRTPGKKGSQEYFNNLRTRGRSTTQSPVTSERTERRRTQLDRRRFRTETRATTLKPEVQTETSVSTSKSNILLRRRIRPTTSTSTTTEEPYVEQEEDSSLEESKTGDEAQGIQDLTDPAVVAIHHLAKVSPGPIAPVVTPSLSSHSESPITYTVHVTPSELASFTTPGRIASVTPGSVSPRPTPIITLKPYTVPAVTKQFVAKQTPVPVRTPSPFRGTGISISTGEPFIPQSEPVVQSRRPEITQRVKVQAPVVATVPQRVPSSKPKRVKPFSKVPKQEAVQSVNSPEPPLDYEYYDDDEDPLANIPASALKVKVHSDGYIECFDRGNFPHPFSCKKFISCAKMENNELLGWEYTCPKHLSFDPVGGICNWSAGLGCQH